MKTVKKSDVKFDGMVFNADLCGGGNKYAVVIERGLVDSRK